MISHVTGVHNAFLRQTDFEDGTTYRHIAKRVHGKKVANHSANVIKTSFSCTTNVQFVVTDITVNNQRQTQNQLHNGQPNIAMDQQRQELM